MPQAVPPVRSTVKSAARLRIEQEIRAAQEEAPEAVAGRSLLVRGLSVWLLLPAAFRRVVWAWALHNPYRRKRLMGMGGLTAVGMFGRGTGWGIAPMVHTLTLVVGGLTRKPGSVRL